jgi:hypothetical protein
LKDILKKFAKIGLPIIIGVVLIWYQFRGLKQEEFGAIKKAFSEVNYYWIVLSVFLGILSHLSRSIRWSYTLKPLGYAPPLHNRFFAVMAGYLMNMLVPRMGEVSRAMVLLKTNDVPFDKGFGTIVAERIADFLVLLSFIIVVVWIQFDSLYELYAYEISQINPWKFIIIGLIGLAVAVFGWVFIKNSTNAIASKIRSFVVGIFEGVSSILTMKDKWKFIFHTFFIWLMYYGMFFVATWCFPETTEISTKGIITAFVVGGLSIAFTNGGLGAYPLGVAKIFTLYGVLEVYGVSFGWLVWTSQTIMILVLGISSFILIPVFNKHVRDTKKNISAA